MARRRLLIDTNVLIDYCDKQRPCHDDAVRLVHAAATKGIELVVLVSSLKDLYYILCRRLQSEPLARKATEVASKSVFTVVDLLAPYASLALASDEPDFEDGLVRTAAEQMGVEAIVSRDERAYAHARMLRLDAREALERLVM
ncbi:MAG: PIN domain-containing protein [Atopobiaceae bacterium]|nr:PIN domain-containing protein [Atopobiaceae bacterium]